MTTHRFERGWAGHFICSDRCRFRRNTLLVWGNPARTGKAVRIVVSTVGDMEPREGATDHWSRCVGAGDRIYETMVFHATWEEPYWEADVEREIYLNGKWSICASEFRREHDREANAMHEEAVNEVRRRMNAGEWEPEPQPPRAATR